jgi:hypothetical protein
MWVTIRAWFRSPSNRSRSPSTLGEILCATWPVSRLGVTPLSKLADPSHTGPASAPISSTSHNRTCWGRSALTPCGFLECEGFPPSLEEERTDRRVLVGPIEHDAADDLHARLQRDQVRRVPAGDVKGGNDILAAFRQTNVDRELPEFLAPSP